MNNLGTLHRPIGGDDWGIREISGIDGKKLRHFFLSLLWRAAATKRFEFSEINVSDERLEVLRETVEKGVVQPASFFPISLTQLSTRGVVHNYAPRAVVKTVPASDTTPEFNVPTFRFYLDGLIAHIHDEGPGSYHPNDPTLVGMSDSFFVSTIPFARSAQHCNLKDCVDEFERFSR